MPGLCMKLRGYWRFDALKTLKFKYYLKIDFDCPITHHSFSVRCVPQTDERQKIISHKIHIIPKEFLCENRDSFGNIYYFGKEENAHQLFEVVSEGTVQTGMSQGTKAAPDYRLGMFLKQTEYTEPGSEIKEFFQKLVLPKDGNNLERSLTIMEALRKNFHYVSGKTNINTTAEQAWNMGCGVCQDYAHIMISLCRMAGIQTRYVAGMLIGEGASHAWVEVADHGTWYGIDPTNGTRVLDEHIKISHGRDYKDCLINQGVFTGNAVQSQSISVSVHEMMEGERNT